MRILFSILLLSSSLLLSAQEIYIVNNANQLRILNVQDFSVTDLFTIPTSTAGVMTDLAFSPDGTLYGITDTRKIIEIDLVNESFTTITELFLGDTYTGLVCNSQNELFYNRYITRKLYSYNLDTEETTFISDEISTPGDFTYYKGNLVYPSFFNDFIIAYDGQTETNIGCAVTELWTFVNVFDDCNNNTIYGIDQLSRVYRYDLESENFEEVANLFSVAGQIYGGASPNEYMASDCPVQTLNSVSCTLATNSNNPYEITYYPNPTESRIYIETQYPFDLSYTIYDVLGTVIDKGPLKNSQITLEDLTSGMYFLKLTDERNRVIFQNRVLKR